MFYFGVELWAFCRNKTKQNKTNKQTNKQTKTIRMYLHQLYHIDMFLKKKKKVKVLMFWGILTKQNFYECKRHFDRFDNDLKLWKIIASRYSEADSKISNNSNILFDSIHERHFEHKSYCDGGRLYKISYCIFKDTFKNE